MDLPFLMSRRALWLAVAVLGCHRLHDGEIDAFRCEEIGVFGPPACPEGLTCVAGTCTDIGVPLGFACASDADCPPTSSCLDPAAFGASGAPRCSRLCCSSGDCGPPADGMVCWLPETTTGGLCWPAAELERPPPGEGRPGTACAGPGDCRSALCTDDVCRDACCGDAYCAGELTCRPRLTEVAEREAFACGPAGGPMASGICDSDDDCRSGTCLVSEEEAIGICATPCCSSSECVEVLVGSVARPVACATVGGTLRACSRVMPPTSTGPVGAACVDGDDCRSGVCLDVGGTRVCSDSCCDDESCGDVTAFSCRPVQEGATWALRCVPK